MYEIHCRVSAASHADVRAWVDKFIIPYTDKCHMECPLIITDVPDPVNVHEVVEGASI